METTILQHDGVQIVLADLPGSHTTTVEIFVRAGSIYETKEINGLAHFQEHMFFKGGKKYPTPELVASTVDAFGGRFNAFTGGQYVGYYITSAAKYTYQAIELLADMMLHATFPEEEIDEEREVILQELNMGLDSPKWLINKKRMRWYYGDTSFGWPAIGTKKNIKERISRDDLVQYKDDYYTKDNMVIVVAGKIPDKEKVSTYLTKLFADLPATKKPTNISFPGRYPSSHEKHEQLPTRSNHLILGIPGYTLFDERRFAARLLAVILGGNMSSRLFQELREKRGLCYYIRANHFESAYEGVYKIEAGFAKNKWTSGKQALYEQLDRVAAGDITQEELDFAKGFLQGKAALDIETSSQLANFAGPQYLYFGEIKDLAAIYAAYDQVTLEEVQQVAADFGADNRYLYRLE